MIWARMLAYITGTSPTHDFFDYRTWPACASVTTYDSLLSSIPRTIVQLNPSFSDSLKEPHAVLATQSRPQHGLL
jgi:hypothetical protein